MARSVVRSVECAFTVTGKGPPVFMVHGIGARRATWVGLVERIDDDVTCITYEVRGHGEPPAAMVRSGSANWWRTSVGSLTGRGLRRTQGVSIACSAMRASAKCLRSMFTAPRLLGRRRARRRRRRPPPHGGRDHGLAVSVDRRVIESTELH